MVDLNRVETVIRTDCRVMGVLSVRCIRQNVFSSAGHQHNEEVNPGGGKRGRNLKVSRWDLTQCWSIHMIRYMHPDRSSRRAGSNAVGSVCRFKGSNFDRQLCLSRRKV